jgi:hypothetical protein
MSRLVGRFAVLVGAAMAIISFFVPWVAARTLESALPLLSALGDLLREGVGDVIGDAGQFTSFTGMQLTTDLPWATTWFKVPIILPPVLGGVALLWLLVTVAISLGNGRTVDLGLALGCGVTAVLLIFNASNIGHLSVKAGLVTAAMNLSGLRLAIGYWLALAALLIMILGLILGVSRVPLSVEDDEMPSYS